MGWFDGFPFKTKAQLEKERKDFENRVFPLGPPEREAVLQLLRALVKGGRRVRDSERLYAFISAKDQYTSRDDFEEGLSAADAELQKQGWLEPQDRRVVLALVRLETGIESLAELPTPEMVRAAADEE